MYQDYDNAVGKVNKYLTKNHFSISVIYSNLNSIWKKNMFPIHMGSHNVVKK